LHRAQRVIEQGFAPTGTKPYKAIKTGQEAFVGVVHKHWYRFAEKTAHDSSKNPVFGGDDPKKHRQKAPARHLIGR